jgi:hypothetical protein
VRNLVAWRARAVESFTYQDMHVAMCCFTETGAQITSRWPARYGTQNFSAHTFFKAVLVNNYAVTRSHITETARLVAWKVRNRSPLCHRRRI